MPDNIPVAYVDDLLDLRRGWITSRLDGGRMVLTRYVGDGSPLGHISCTVDEAHKLCAVVQAWLETLLPSGMVQESVDKYLQAARRGIEVERLKEQTEKLVNGYPSQGSE